jgi:hypothetical protein
MIMRGLAMLDPEPRPEPSDASIPVDPARMALHVFAELTQIGGTNAVADTQGIAAVSPALLAGLMRLLDAEGVPADSVVRHVLEQHRQERARTDGSVGKEPTSPAE